LDDYKLTEWFFFYWCTGSPRWSWKKGHKTVVVWWWIDVVTSDH